MDAPLDVFRSTNSILWGSTVVAGATALLSFFKPRWAIPGFFIWVAAADVLKRLLFLGSEATPTQAEYFWILALPDLVLAAAMGGIVLTAIRARSLPWRWTTLDSLVAAYLLWSFLEVFNPTFSLTVRLAGFKSSGIYVLVYFLVRAADAQEKGWFKRLLPVLIGSGLVAAVYALYQSAVGFQEFEMEWLESGLTMLGGQGGELGRTINWFGIARPFSIFASHEQLGWYLSFVVLLMLAVRVQGRWSWGVLFVLVLAIARTLSRSSWVFLGASLLFLGIGGLIAARKRLVRNGAAALVLMLVCLGLWSYLERRTNEQPATAEDSQANPFVQRASTLGTYEWRIYSFQQLIRDPSWRRPFGNGIGSMWVAWRLGAPGTLNREERVLSHVGTVDLIYELGVVGMLSFLAIIAYLAWLVWRVLKHPLESEGVELLVVTSASVLGLVVANSTVTTVLMFRPIASPFWLSLGIAGCVLAARERPTSSLGTEAT